MMPLSIFSLTTDSYAKHAYNDHSLKDSHKKNFRTHEPKKEIHETDDRYFQILTGENRNSQTIPIDNPRNIPATKQMTLHEALAELSDEHAARGDVRSGTHPKLKQSRISHSKLMFKKLECKFNLH